MNAFAVEREALISREWRRGGSEARKREAVCNRKGGGTNWVLSNRDPPIRKKGKANSDKNVTAKIDTHQNGSRIPFFFFFF